MAAEKIYPDGIRIFPRRDKAPTWVKGSVVITPNLLFAWLKKNENLLDEYKGDKQLRLDLLENDKGLYVVVNTFKPDSSKKSGAAITDAVDDLPF